MEFLADKDALARIQAATDYPLQRSADGWIVGHFFHCRQNLVVAVQARLLESVKDGHGRLLKKCST